MKTINKVRNIKTVKITIPNEQILKRVNSTPTGVQSETQKDFQEQVEKLGFEYILVRSLDNFKISINKYL